MGEFTGGLHEVSRVQMIMCSFDRDDIHLQVTTREHRANSNKSLAIFWCILHQINSEGTEHVLSFQVIPREFLSLFTADEFSLLINGVAKLDVGDWKKHTEVNYRSWYLQLFNWMKKERMGKTRFCFESEGKVSRYRFFFNTNKPTNKRQHN